MKAFLDILEQLYRKILLGATLENDSHDYVFYLSLAFSDQDCSDCSDNLDVEGVHRPSSVHLATVSIAPVCLKRHSQMSSTREVMLLQLTVIKVMITRTLSVETEFHAKEKYRDIIKILLKSSDIDSKLTCMFQNSDKLLSHMAAKCLALLLYFQLREKITLSNSWIAFCQKNLSEYPERDKALYCLSTLTIVMKEILKDTCSQKTEILKQFLTPFNTIFEVFYNSLFSQHFENHQDFSKIVNSLICFLELLELLIASRIHLKLHFTCQRILFLKPSCVLDVISWPVQAFVKRKFIIFIKKCLLCKVGEDLCRGSVPALMPPDDHLDVDMLALADAVLQAVDLGLLRTLSVHGKPSHFGGDEVQPGWEHVPGPDYVILRAASLPIIRSLEIKFQNCASADEMKVDLQRFMSELLTFLKRHLQPSLQSHNLCEWLSRVFVEQDDDMLEAAKALLGIYLKLTRASPSLVDYDSSDDSEEESTNQRLANSRLTSFHQEAVKKIQDRIGTSRGEKELSLKPQSRPLVPKESNTPFSVDCDLASDSTASQVGICYRTVKCFEELRGAIYRLQKKNLFPYNPTALLKLLKHVEAIYNKSLNPLYNSGILFPRTVFP
ncbi:Protein Lines-like protein 1 [Camelus dromedarius]|uniref:Protein Lines-like protein 1 n=1 Tax=Camelus dromedarius TaxID=9838 RepID=A0A5N4CEH4_CAMDR|nr:Protein Lines-like protein 1 [Camelus dromedarius]KAB1257312.1 Protein Lines-like protein 1 [Camelus dromedarius]